MRSVRVSVNDRSSRFQNSSASAAAFSAAAGAETTSVPLAFQPSK